MTQLTDTKIQTTGDAAVGADLAAVYIRVSSSGQLGRDGDDDGYSIPAQVQACQRKAADLPATALEPYIERAESARSDDRPVLQQMLSELPQLGVRYLIVHKVDRLARNRLDDARLYERLIGMNITLVSATENIDATPAGRLMHGMLATFAEYYSNNLATEVLKGLNQKARTGGTPMRAPLGYLNVRRISEEGREIRTVDVDADRAPLIRLAFDLYATGEWSVIGLTDYLNALGLRTRPTPGRPSKEVAPSLVYGMLQNRYYVGDLVWKGAVYEGRHDPLIDRESFARVQEVLVAHGRSGDHRMKQHHYLKGTLYCAHCGDRLVYGLSRGRNGMQYAYFFCIGRVKRTGCANRANLRAEVLEEAVEQEYGCVQRALDAAHLDRTRDAIRAHFARLRETAAKSEGQQRRRVDKLKDQRRELLDLRFEKAIALDLFRERQATLTRDIETAETILAALEAEHAEAESVLIQAVNFSGGVETLYRRAAADPKLRRMLNQLIFERIEVEVDGVVHAELAQPFADIRAGRLVDRLKTAIVALRKALETANPSHFFDGQGSNSIRMVGAAGFEPATSRV